MKGFGERYSSFQSITSARSVLAGTVYSYTEDFFRKSFRKIRGEIVYHQVCVDKTTKTRTFADDGNGRVGRLILFKECLKYNIVPFIIEDNLKLFYYRGLKEWDHEKVFLMDTCLTAQDRFKAYLDYFRIAY